MKSKQACLAAPHMLSCSGRLPEPLHLIHTHLQSLGFGDEPNYAALHKWLADLQQWQPPTLPAEPMASPAETQIAADAGAAPVPRAASAEYAAAYEHHLAAVQAAQQQAAHAQQQHEQQQQQQAALLSAPAADAAASFGSPAVQVAPIERAAWPSFTPTPPPRPPVSQTAAAAVAGPSAAAPLSLGLPLVHAHATALPQAEASSAGQPSTSNQPTGAKAAPVSDEPSSKRLKADAGDVSKPPAPASQPPTGAPAAALPSAAPAAMANGAAVDPSYLAAYIRSTREGALSQESHKALQGLAALPPADALGVVAAVCDLLAHSTTSASTPLVSEFLQEVSSFASQSAAAAAAKYAAAATSASKQHQ